MILKNADSKEQDIQELRSLISVASVDVKPRIEKELRILEAGIKGEKEARYLIDFELRSSKNSLVIHDLRLEYKDRVAQIDHLLLHRSLNFYVVETKHFNAGISINENGEFMQWNAFRKSFEGIPSPFAQNLRHISVLQDVFENQIDMPKRLGLTLNPNFHSKVVLNSESRIDRPKRFDTSDLIKAEALIKHLQSDLENMGLFNVVAKVVSTETLEHIASQLIKLHRPRKTDYAAKFGVALSSTKTDNSNAITSIKEPNKAKISPDNDSSLVCKKCNGANIKIQYGKFGYYFKCSDCNGNSNIRITCGKDGHIERLRKDGSKFYRECADCKTSSLFFEN